jgi:hypothetical protein
MLETHQLRLSWLLYMAVLLLLLCTIYSNGLLIPLLTHEIGSALVAKAAPDRYDAVVFDVLLVSNQVPKSESKHDAHFSI